MNAKPGARQISFRRFANCRRRRQGVNVEAARLMSVLGQSATQAGHVLMSERRPKPDIKPRRVNVAGVPQADFREKPTGQGPRKEGIFDLFRAHSKRFYRLI